MWDQRYAGDSYAYGVEPNDFLRLNASRLPVGNTLCLAEGEGRNAVYLAGLGHRVTAVDASAVGLDKAVQLADAKNVNIHTVHRDLNEFVVEPGRWDAIVSIFCHLPPGLRIKLHRQVVAGLRPGGMFILEAYTPAQLERGTGGPPVEAMMMDLASLKTELAGLELELGTELVREIHEGDYHNGAGAVVQIVAVRAE